MAIVDKFAGDIHYIACEPAKSNLPKLLLVHGAGGYADAWRSILETFRTVDPIAIDMPGHGKSTGALPHTAEEQAEVVEKLRTALGIEAFYIVGHSLGGAVAQCYARKYPSNVRGIVISNSGAIFGAGQTEADVQAQLDRIEHNWPAAIEHYASGQVSPRASAAAKAAAFDIVRKRSQMVMHHDVSVVRRFDSRAWAGQIPTPTLVIAGYEDSLTPFGMSAEVYGLIPHAEFAVVSPGGHSPFLEHPKRYVATIESFIADSL